jgi:hypothetical protein
MRVVTNASLFASAEIVKDRDVATAEVLDQIQRITGVAPGSSVSRCAVGIRRSWPCSAS